MKKFLCVIILSCTALGIYADTKGEEIALKRFNLTKPQDLACQAKMILIDKNGNKQLRILTMFSKQGPFGTNSFSEFLEPADVKGTKFLNLVEKDGENVQRLYLPALKKVRRIATSAKDSKFMGSDLFYYDLEEHDFDEFKFEFLAENQTIDGKNYENMKFYIIKAVPKDPAAPYSRMEMWINMDNYFTYKLIPYDKNGYPEKTILILEVKNIDNILIGTTLLVINQKDNHKTLLSKENIKINSGLEENIFQIQNLK